MGTYIQAEPSQATGRPDCVAYLPEATYIIEMKINSNAAVALEQINTKNYAAPYQHLSKTVYALALNINTTQQTVDDWLLQPL